MSRSTRMGILGMTKRETFWWVALLGYVIFVTSQAVMKGADQFVHPIPFPTWASNLIFAFMVTIALTGCTLYARNLWLYHDRFNFQEKFFRRGAILIMFGGAMGYLARVFTQDATVTYATPIILIGYFMAIYAIVGTPVRQDAEDAVMKQMQAELDRYHQQEQDQSHTHRRTG